jgi:putative membrane protein insertion efficiency factor
MNALQASRARTRPLWAVCRAAPQRVLIGVVLGYRLLFKPWLGNACRFEPSCSAYALDALRRHGALAGGTLAAARLLRCHPWCAGGCDPVPEHAPRLLTRLLAKTRP